jgi:hypothetical protein
LNKVSIHQWVVYHDCNFTAVAAARSVESCGFADLKPKCSDPFLIGQTTPILLTFSEAQEKLNSGAWWINYSVL